MSLPSSPALQPLRRLDRSSPDFQDKLCNILYGWEYVQCEQTLGEDDLIWFIDYLDKALDCLDPSSPASRKCLRELRIICGSKAMLPTSYNLPAHLLEIEPEPFTAGGSSDVYKATFRGSGVCVKRVRVYIQDGPQTPAKIFCQEAVTWKRLTHPNILPLLGITVNPFQLISNWVTGGDLQEYIGKHPDADRLRLLSDVAEGLSYLHSCNVIHGDLKGPNILVENSGHVRIADFGLAKITHNLDSIRGASYQHGLTLRWAAPEVFNKGEYSKEADIFSFAMVMIEVFTGAVPFSDRPSLAATISMTQGERPPRPTYPTFTENMWRLMQRCWNHDPHLRPEVSEVLQVLFTPNIPAWKRLIRYPLSIDERIRLITSIFSDPDEVEVVEHLSGDDAQTFIDTIDKVLDGLAPEIRRRCLHYLHRICGRRNLLPKSLPISLCYNPMEAPLFLGEFSDVWKGQHNGREVAAKVLRVSKGDLERTRKRFCKNVMIWKTLHHPNVLPLLGVTMVENRFVTVSEWMKNGTINEFTKAHPNANRSELLADVTKGLIYMHDQGIVHGDLRGSHILIKNDYRACLADSSLLTIIPDEPTITPSDSSGSTTQRVGGTRWPAPEVSRGGAPSKEADIFSLAMVMTEVFTGTAPFSDVPSATAALAITRGEPPPRPTHPAVTGGLWKLMYRCWDGDPHLRPGAAEVLQILLDCNPPAWKRLISDPLSASGRISLIKSIFSDRDEIVVFEYLSGDDAQAFVDVMDEVLESDNIPPEIRRRCLRSLYRICGREALLPKSLPIPLCYNPMETSQRFGGVADVWKGKYNGREVAAKVLRVYLTSDIEGIRKRFCKEVMIWKTLRHPNVLPLLGVTVTENPHRFVMVSEWMENGNVNEFVKAHPDVNQPELLVDVTKGLIYMHDQGIVHGDLKGSNILIDNNGRARLAGFSLITLIPDQSTPSSPDGEREGGTVRWMSPELLDPKKFGLPKGQPTRESDCYALGMVIYEIFSGCAPFGTDSSFAILRKIINGGRPERPEGEAGRLFTDDIWDVVELCWKNEPSERATAKAVLVCLQGNSFNTGGDDNQSDVESIDSGLSITRGDEGFPVPSLGPPLNIPTRPAVPQGGNQLPNPLHPGSPDEGRFGGLLARIPWNVFNPTTK